MGAPGGVEPEGGVAPPDEPAPVEPEGVPSDSDIGTLQGFLKAIEPLRDRARAAFPGGFDAPGNEARGHALVTEVPADNSGFRNETREVQDLIAEPTSREGIERGIQWVLDKGQADGFEHLIMGDTDSGTVFAATSLEVDAVRFFPALDERVRFGPGHYVAIHNHPSNTAVSEADLKMLVHDRLGTIIAVGHQGTVTAARRTSAMTEEFQSDYKNLAGRFLAMGHLTERVSREVRKVLQREIDAGNITKAQSFAEEADQRNRVLAELGVLDYATTYQTLLPGLAAEVAQELRSHEGIVLVHDRRPGLVRQSRGMAGILDQVEDAPAGRPGDRPTDPEGEAGTGPQEERPGADAGRLGGGEPPDGRAAGASRLGHEGTVLVHDRRPVPVGQSRGVAGIPDHVGDAPAGRRGGQATDRGGEGGTGPQAAGASPLDRQIVLGVEDPPADFDARSSPTTAGGRPGRARLRAGFPKIPVSTTIARLKAQPGYEAAKRGGDDDAAVEVVEAVFKPETVARLGLDDPEDVIVVSVALRETEAAEFNRLPHVLAHRVAAELGATASDGRIVQANVTSHTGAGMTERMVSRPVFDGPVEAGRRYVLVDDVVTSGSTLLELASHIEANGGTVAGAITLAASRGGTILTVHPETLQRLRQRHGDQEARFREAFGYGFDRLTEREAYDLARARDETVHRIVAGRERALDGEHTPHLRREERGQEDPPLAGQTRPEDGTAEDPPAEFDARSPLTTIGGGRAMRAGRGPTAGPGDRYVGMHKQPETGAPRRRTPLSREKALRDLANALRVTFYVGRIRRRSPVLGFFRPWTEEIRLKNPADLEVAIHEAAHLIDKRFAEVQRQWYPASNANKAIRDELRSVSYDERLLFEGFAEFVRLWATQPETLADRTPLFLEWWEGFLDRHPQEGKAIRRFKEEALGWYNQSALDRARSKVGHPVDVNASLNTLRGRFRQSVTDDLHGIYRMERDLMGSIEPGGAYETARLLRGKAAVVEGAILYGAPVAQPDGSAKFEGKGLNQILEPVADKLDDFLMYAVGRSANELRGQGRERLFTGTEIKAMLALEQPSFVRAFEEYQDWNNAILDFAEAKGAINPATRQAWRRAQYLPFHRVSMPGTPALNCCS